MPVDNDARGNVSYQSRAAAQELPAGQPKSSHVVEMNGEPYTRGIPDTFNPATRLAHGLTNLTTAAMVGEVVAMYGIAEIDTPEGKRLVVIQYGVPSNQEAFSMRMLDVLTTARNRT